MDSTFPSNSTSFGSPMPTRVWSNTGTKYKYGFNGKEKDDEVNVNGGDYDFGARIYDGRLGRWLSLDPMMEIAHYESNYIFVSGNPLIYKDIKGKTKYRTYIITNELTGETTTLKITVNSDLKKDNVWHTSLGGNDRYYNVGWYDINETVNITIKKDGTREVSPPSQTLGALRYEVNPLADKLGINDTQDDVNEELEEDKDSKQKKWGGVSWTWAAGQGGETRKGSADVSIENIDMLMDVLTSMSPNELNIPGGMLKDNGALEVVNVLMKTIDRQGGTIDNSLKALEGLRDQIDKWKKENTVTYCNGCGQYRDNKNNGSDTIPNGKKASSDTLETH